MEELISVIVPVYNVEKYLEKCIDSIINQTYKNIEILLIDDGSTDSSGEICDRYAIKDKRILVFHKENGGLSDARNKGIDIATGKYISFIDSDDYVEENYISFLYEILKKFDADISMGKHYVRYQENTIDTSSGQELCMNPEVTLEKMLYGEDVDVSAWAKLYKKDLFKDIRFPKGRVFEDAATTYKLIDKSSQVAFKSLPIYNYVMRKNSITNTSFNSSKMDLIVSTKEMANYVKDKYPNLKNAADRRVMYAYLSTLTQLAKSKHFSKEDYQIIMSYIKENRKRILKDKRIPKRDRIAIYSTYFGLVGYKIMWNIYSFVTGRN